VTAERIARFPGAVVMTEWRGPDDGDDRAYDAVPGCGGDGDGSGADQGGGDIVSGAVVKLEEERDGDGGEGGEGAGRIGSRVQR
jgi:hypothetical protein